MRGGTDRRERKVSGFDSGGWTPSSPATQAGGIVLLRGSLRAVRISTTAPGVDRQAKRPSRHPGSGGAYVGWLVLELRERVAAIRLQLAELGFKRTSEDRAACAVFCLGALVQAV
jgi:hypothetical protein